MFSCSRRNPDQAQVIKPYDGGSLVSSNFDPSKPTKVIVHGFLSSQKRGTGGSRLREGKCSTLRSLSRKLIAGNLEIFNLRSLLLCQIMTSIIGKFSRVKVGEAWFYVGGFSLMKSVMMKEENVISSV